METLTETVKRFGYLFYVMDPRKHNYEHIDDVRDYYKEVIPFFVVTILLEQAVRLYQKKPLTRISDTISSGLHGFVMDLSKIPFKGAEVWVYAYIYTNYRLVDLPWDSPWTWIACWFITDFCYYWMHRMIHQVNILWAIHETHHVPEDMVFSAPMRNHIFLLPIHWITYLPMALAIPPTTYLVHYQISIIFQYWLHTEIIHKLPAPMEFLFSTPSHHRAHHGRNRRYIDKNFGGFLIVWDRLFGTFEAEDPEEKPIYGVTTQMKSYNPLIVQTRQFVHIWNKFWEYERIEDKLSAIFKGPGWSPGKPWTGNLEDIPHPAPDWEKYDPELPLWCRAYTIIHFSFLLNGYLMLALNMTVATKLTIAVAASYITYCSISMGFVLDKSRFGPPLEIIKCILYFPLDKIVLSEVRKLETAQMSMADIHHLARWDTPMSLLETAFLANRTLAILSLFMWISMYFHQHVRSLRKEKVL